MNYINYFLFLLIAYPLYNYFYQEYIYIISTEIPFNEIAKYNYSSVEIYSNFAYLWINNSTQPMKTKYFDVNHLVNNLNNSTDYQLYFKEESFINAWTIIYYIFLYFLITTIFETLSSNLIDKNNLEINIAEDIDVSFEDIAGNNEQKEEANEFVDFILNNQKYESMGAKLPKGALFIGPTGTGKTLLAKAIAGESEIPFIYSSGSDFNEMFVGLGALRIKNLFKKAREMKPCIIFIDEIDVLAMKRSGKNMHHNDRDNTLNALLVEMDGFKTEEGIIVFAATNRPDVLDPAILRPGRFDRKIYFSLPDKNDRNDILSYYLNKINLSDNISFKHLLNTLTNCTFGFTGADLSNLCNESAIIAVRNNSESISKKHLDEAFDYVTVGVEKKKYFLNEFEKKSIAIHEIGHAFLAFVLKDASDPINISIIPRGKSALGYTMTSNEEKKLQTQNELIAEICVLCGGRINEKIFNNKITTGASDDFRKASNLAFTLFSNYLMIDDKNKYYYDETLSESSKAYLEKNSNLFLQNIYKKCEEIIN